MKDFLEMTALLMLQIHAAEISTRRAKSNVAEPLTILILPLLVVTKVMMIVSMRMKILVCVVNDLISAIGSNVEVCSESQASTTATSRRSF